MNWRHIFGITLRNVYLTRRSLPRIAGIFLWVTVEIFFWGFITFWLEDIASENSAVNFVLIVFSALIFWDVFVKVQQSFSVSFLEDIWSRNILNIFSSPITPKELVAGFATLSIIQAILGLFYGAILAGILYTLHIWELGFYILPFFINILIFGWALGLFTVALMIRFGPSIEMISFFLPFAILPLSAVFHPASAFPESIARVAVALPTFHLFEGMRTVLLNDIFPLHAILWASGLNIIYFAFSFLFFYWMIRVAKKRGFIARLVTD